MTSQLITGKALLTASARWIETCEQGPEWIESLPEKHKHVIKKWNLTEVQSALPGATVSLTFPAHYQNRDVIIKIQYPHPECAFEAEALKVWNGNGAIPLLKSFPEIHALMLPRAKPGITLHQALKDNPDTPALDIITEILQKILVPTTLKINSLEDEASQWIKGLTYIYRNDTTNKFPKPLIKYTIDAAISLLNTLPETRVLVHQDMHPGNILDHAGEWKAIDPKPVIGEPALALAPVIRNSLLNDNKQKMNHTLTTLSSNLTINRERARLWTMVQTLAWGVWSPNHKQHLKTVQWLAEM